VGDRSNLYFRDGDDGVGVYAHWAGTGMAAAAMAVLKSKAFKARLGDTSYALRIGVQTALESLAASATEETGFGLWTAAAGPDDNNYKYIVIDLESGDCYVTGNWKKPPAKDKVEAPTVKSLEALMTA
jgi:hypothetical protein